MSGKKYYDDSDYDSTSEEEMENKDGNKRNEVSQNLITDANPSFVPQYVQLLSSDNQMLWRDIANIEDESQQPELRELSPVREFWESVANNEAQLQNQQPEGQAEQRLIVSLPKFREEFQQGSLQGQQSQLSDFAPVNYFLELNANEESSTNIIDDNKPSTSSAAITRSKTRLQGQQSQLSYCAPVNSVLELNANEESQQQQKKQQQSNPSTNINDDNRPSTSSAALTRSKRRLTAQRKAAKKISRIRRSARSNKFRDNEPALTPLYHNDSNLRIPIPPLEPINVEESDTNMIRLGSYGTCLANSTYQFISFRTVSGALRYLLAEFFSSETLATHSMTGRPAPSHIRYNLPYKPRLDARIVADIVENVSRMCQATKREVRLTMTAVLLYESQRVKMAKEKKEEKKREKEDKKEE